MTQFTKLLIAFFAGMIWLTIVGTITEIFWEDVIIEKQIIISAELQECEKLGGEFGILKSDFSGKYNIWCKIPEKNLFEYELEFNNNK